MGVQEGYSRVQWGYTRGTVVVVVLVEVVVVVVWWWWWCGVVWWWRCGGVVQRGYKGGTDGVHWGNTGGTVGVQ